MTYLYPTRLYYLCGQSPTKQIVHSEIKAAILGAPRSSSGGDPFMFDKLITMTPTVGLLPSKPGEPHLIT